MPYQNTISQSPAAANRIQNAVASAAQATGVDFNFLMNQARIESGLNPSARASTSSATGLFQFTKQSWLATLKQHGAEHGLGWAADTIQQGPGGNYRITDPALATQIFDLREQPEAASAMAAEFATDNGAYLTDALGRAPEQVDLYLAHFLGAAGAAKFLKAHDANPDAAAASELPKAAAANRGIFYGPGGTRSFGEIRARFAAKLSGGTFVAPRQSSITSISLAATPHFDEHANLAPMRAIEPMPTHLSLDFARSAYGRLAAMDGGVRT
jgi:Transglycosylase SLT domain